MNRARWVTLALLLSSVHAGTAAAQPEPSAEELFERGWDAMDKRDYESACSLFEESYKISRATGPLQGLASCHEARGRIREALLLYRDALATLPKGSSSRPDVQRAVQRLEARVAKLMVRLPPRATPQTRVELDGHVVSPGTTLEIDPLVRHVILVTPPNEPAYQIELRLEEGEDKTMVLSPPSANGNATPAPPPPASDSTFGPVRIGGIALLATGAASFVAAAVTGALMLEEADTIAEHCAGPNGTECDVLAIEASDRAKSLSPWNVAAFVVGGAALAAGLPMVIVGDGESRGPEVAVSVGPFFTGVHGRF